MNLNNSKFISNIEKVTLESYLWRPSVLSTLTSSIKHLNIHLSDPSKFLSDLIQSKPQLLSLTIQCLNGKFSFSNDTFKLFPNSLTSIKFVYCDFLKSLLNISTPLKIKTLKVVGKIKGITLLIQKVGSYLEHLELDISSASDKYKTTESIANYCDKIKFLCISFDEGNEL
ncbi:4771_t:CDS:2 [Funneliformis caledonium]|uniref:4771_t:CDS:1 n=1 Tax=Funneliformis caledonium TaxID=1117310 RepID=A0A9N9AR60_9GLOM|nr:4771_t:CDS:2 [Funneliformis caledonium]